MRDSYERIVTCLGGAPTGVRGRTPAVVIDESQLLDHHEVDAIRRTDRVVDRGLRKLCVIDRGRGGADTLGAQGIGLSALPTAWILRAAARLVDGPPSAG